ncbi:hypothetical protein CA850_04840 [Micromonospora echinospora]|uniref:Glycosyl transferases group 1 n=1 Tax=Micromonospora echinospora TaxID=1877 RepID=A0A1C4ZUL1_MICEC|nr:glycosyltransferase family 4 protein [Micromonospora echinospora]OZV83959.1 hypothetical protein CA850_04840 [Micromonospora echinospora]SCF36717.1 Glycosyl transferases group 1 [Micromonospora echinospora]
MTLTVVCSYFPLPQDRGDPVRVLMALRALASVRDHTLLVVRRPDTRPEQVDQLRRMLPGVEVRVFDATAFRCDRFGPAGRYPESLAAGLPPWVRSRWSADLHGELRRRTGVGIALGEAAGAYVRDTPLRWHWDKANVLAASLRQEVEAAAGPVRRLRARYLTRISTRFEATVLSRCATVSVTSAEEAARLRRHHGRTADVVLPSAVALPVGHRPHPHERELVWLGSFAYEPNLVGLRRFLSEGWPRLAAAGHTLDLVGSGLTGPVRATLARHPGVRVLGYVDDLRPVLARSRAAVVPLWSGAGVKLKTLTLLAHAVPVFATPVGAEGVPPSAAVRLAGTPAALAERILGTAPADLDAMAAEAVRLVRDRFSADRFATDLVDSLTACGALDLSEPPPGPAAGRDRSAVADRRPGSTVGRDRSAPADRHTRPER